MNLSTVHESNLTTKPYIQMFFVKVFDSVEDYPSSILFISQCEDEAILFADNHVVSKTNISTLTCGNQSLRGYYFQEREERPIYAVRDDEGSLIVAVYKYTHPTINNNISNKNGTERCTYLKSGEVYITSNYNTEFQYESKN